MRLSKLHPGQEFVVVKSVLSTLGSHSTVHRHNPLLMLLILVGLLIGIWLGWTLCEMNHFNPDEDDLDDDDLRSGYPCRKCGGTGWID